MKEVWNASFHKVYYWTGIDYRNKLLNKSTLWTFCLNWETCICCETTFSPNATTVEPFFATWQKNSAVVRRIFTKFTINSIYVHSIIRFRKTCFLRDLVRIRLISEHFCHEYHDLVRGSVWNSWDLSYRNKKVAKNLKRNQFIESTITLSNKRVSYVNIVKQHSKTCRLSCHQSEWNIKKTKRNETD